MRRTIRRRVAVVVPILWRRCFGSTACSSGMGLSDPAMEEELYEIASMRQFAGLSLARGTVPDETTILNFRHLLEQHGLAREIFDTVKAHLQTAGLLLRQGTIVDATIISAPSSTKNSTGEREPEMHQTKKGNQWYFGMKAHVGVDAESSLVHSVLGTAANVADVTKAHQLLHGGETVAFGDAGYIGVEQRPECKRRIEWHGAARYPSRPAAGEDRASQGAGARSRRARVPSDQAPVRLRQGSLPRPGQEHGAAAHAVCLGQYLDGAPATARDRIAATKPPPIRPRDREQST